MNVAEKLARKGLRTLGDALVYLPLRYEDRTRLVGLAQLEEGSAVAFTGERFCFDVADFFEEGGSDVERLEDCIADIDDIVTSLGAYLGSIVVTRTLPAGFVATTNPNEFAFDVQLAKVRSNASTACRPTGR